MYKYPFVYGEPAVNIGDRGSAYIICPLQHNNHLKYP